MWNLLRNAAEASPTELPIDIAVDRYGDFGRLRVRDHGAGISAENRVHLFEPFFSTKKGGTGLGLATIHRIVDEHKGRIEAESPEDGGAAFIVRSCRWPKPTQMHRFRRSSRRGGGGTDRRRTPRP